MNKLRTPPPNRKKVHIKRPIRGELVILFFCLIGNHKKNIFFISKINFHKRIEEVLKLNGHYGAKKSLMFSYSVAVEKEMGRGRGYRINKATLLRLKKMKETQG